MEQTNISSLEKSLTDFGSLVIPLMGDKRFDFISSANTQFLVEEKQGNAALDVLGSSSLVSWGMAGKNNLVINPANVMNQQGSVAFFFKPDISLHMTGMVIPKDSSPDETRNSLGVKYADKLVALEKKLGKEQFRKLSFSQQIFMANTFGTIDLGKNVDIQSVYESTQDE